jgi:hypothetical protein
MDDESDPEVTKINVPSFGTVERKIQQIDAAVMILRVFFVPVQLIYRFQLLKKGMMCTVEIPKFLLDEIASGDRSSEEELAEILLLSIDNEESWREVL